MIKRQTGNIMATKTNQYNPQIAFHPGETLTEKLEKMGMGPKEFSVRTGKPKKQLLQYSIVKAALLRKWQYSLSMY